MEPQEELPEMGLTDILAIADEDKTELDKIFELLLDNENIRHNTDLTNAEITAFSVLGTLAKRHNLDVLHEFLQENLTLRVSKGRRGRREWVEILKQHLDAPEEAGSSGGLSRYFGRR